MWVAAIGLLANKVMFTDTTGRLIHLVSSGCICCPTSGCRLKTLRDSDENHVFGKINTFHKTLKPQTIEVKQVTILLQCIVLLGNFWVLAFMCMLP